MNAARVALIAGAVGAAACREAPTARSAPASIVVVSDLPSSGLAGSAAGAFVVRVTDAAQRPVPGVLVHFAAMLGGVRVDPAADTTDATGQAQTSVTLSTVPGTNQVAAFVAGLSEARSGTVVGSAGEALTLTVSPRVIRAGTSQSGVSAGATARDKYGNVVNVPVTWSSRDPALVSVTAVQGTTMDGQVLSRPGHTWLVASAGSVTDSVRVAVLDAASSPCAYLATPVELPVGGTLAFEMPGLACVTSQTAAEYAIVAHYNTGIASAFGGVSLVAHGITPPPPGAAPVAPAAAPGADVQREFELGLRERERRDMPPYVSAARAWFDRRAAMRSLAAAPRLGDVMDVNVNAFEFCADPVTRGARVAALSSGTMILSDATNPAGGFSDEEYAAIAAVVDTLVIPVDTAAFGAPTDIDGNGRITILFTRAVNELTPRGSNSGVVLGFFFSRDLLPRAGTGEACPGSNAGEIFYVLVPDPDAQHGNARSKAFVQEVVTATIAHELQHLVNASRRMYVTRSASVNEEVWLNEGLSHMAEELVFYRASGLGPRQNIGPAELAPGSVARAAHDRYMRGNFGLLSVYLRSTDINSPLAFNDALATRGATWGFLRYLADRAGASDGDLWRRLVNSQATGMVNLDAALTGAGLSTLDALRGWAMAMVADDVVPGVPPALTRASWNFAAALPYTGFVYGPGLFVLGNASNAPVTMRSGGTYYYYMAAAAGAESLVQVVSGGGIAIPGMRLTLLRIR